nr:uncharacterized protein LOC109149872 [Ipomoea batatas]
MIDSAGQAPSRGQTTKGLKLVLKRKSATSSGDQHTVGQSPVGSCPSGSSATPSQTKSIGKRPVEAVEVETSGMFNLLFQMSPPTASLVNEMTDNVAKHIAHHLSQVARTSTELFVRARRDVIEREEELRKLKERMLRRVTAWGYHRGKHAMQEFLYHTLEDVLPKD